MIDDSNPPRAREDELDVIAAVLNGAEPEGLHLTSRHFDDPQLQEIWRAILSVSAGGGRCDVPSVRLALGTQGDRLAQGLLVLFSRPVVALNAPPIAAKLRKAAHLRDLQLLAVRINQAAMTAEQEPESIVEMIRAEIDKPTGAIHTTQTFADAMPDLLDELQHGRAAGLSTPWPDLDRKIHGLGRGRLYIIAARPGVGKSLLGQNLAVHWSRKHRLPTYFASLEMPLDEVARRTLAQTSRVELDKLQTGHLLDRDWADVDRAASTMLDDRIHICADGSQTLESIRAGARELKRRVGLGLVIVDYLQIVAPRSDRLPREQQVAEVSRGLKLLAKELQVPVVAMAQVRRLNDGEKTRRPTLNDLRESGSIEQDADAVLMLHIPDEDKQWAAEMLIAKARSGSRGVVTLEMRTHWATILSSAPSHQALEAS